MTTGEIPGGVPGEANQNPGMTLRDRCLTEVQQKILRIERNLVEERDVYDTTKIGPIVSDMAIDAAKSGNLPTAETHMDALWLLSNFRVNSENARTSYQLASAGSQRIYRHLTDQLTEEKSQLALWINDATQERTYEILDSSHIQLRAIVGACQEADDLPDEWIEEYAVNDVDKWYLYADYYRLQAQTNEQNADFYQGLFTDKVIELLEGDFEPPFVYHMTWYALKGVKDPDVKKRLVERFKEITPDIPLTFTSFSKFIAVGEAMLDEEELGTEENIDFFEGKIEVNAEYLQREGIKPFDLTRAQLRWGLARKQHDPHTTPQELVDFLDLQVSQMLSDRDLPETWSGEDLFRITRNKQAIVNTRDSKLYFYACESSENGDFKTAQVFIKNINSTMQMTHALEFCLYYATTQEQIDAIKPDEMTLGFYPQLAIQFRAREAEISSNPTIIAEQSYELAETIHEGDAFGTIASINRLCEALTAIDETRALEVAEHTLDILREHAADPELTRNLSEILIRAGNIQERTERYRDIMAFTLNESERLYQLWQLGKLLSDVYRTY